MDAAGADKLRYRGTDGVVASPGAVSSGASTTTWLMLWVNTVYARLPVVLIPDAEAAGWCPG